MNESIDPSLLAEFIDESEESLAALDSLFVELEHHPDAIDVVNAIFRPIHSLKGNAAFFGLLQTKSLAHKMENVLDTIRQQKMVATKDIVASLLCGLDMLKQILGRVRNGVDEIEGDSRYTEVLNSIIEIEQKRAPTIDMVLHRIYDTVKEVCTKAASDHTGIILDAISDCAQSCGINLNGSPTVSAKVPEFKVSGSIPAEITAIKTICTAHIEKDQEKSSAEELLKNLNSLKTRSNDENTLEIINKAIEDSTVLIEKIGCDPLLRESLMDKIDILTSQGQWHASTASLPAEEKSKTRVTNDTSGAETAKTMRVSEQSIDSFLSYVGELVVIEEMFKQLQKEVGRGGRDEKIVNSFKKTLNLFATLSNNLQKSIMDVRKIPIRTLLQRAPRIVQDVARESGKDIEVTITGDTILVDKSHLETLDAPMTHLLRNAADHGIESPDIRTRAGKNPCGSIRIEVQETDKELSIRIADDGAGINYEKVRAKAVSLGIVTKDEVLSDEASAELLFLSGVSTASKVTDVSGRGVGMDVVKRTVEQAGGGVTVSSSMGSGTEFMIRLPRSVSTQIIDGFCVRVGKNVYLFPLEHIQESFTVMSHEIHQVAGNAESVMHHNELVPVIRMSKVLAHSYNENEQPSVQIMVTVLIRNKEYAFAVDELLNIQKVVVKDIKGLPTSMKYFKGGALQGDGTIALIFSEEGLWQLVDDLCA